MCLPHIAALSIYYIAIIIHLSGEKCVRILNEKLNTNIEYYNVQFTFEITHSSFCSTIIDRLFDNFIIPFPIVINSINFNWIFQSRKSEREPFGPTRLHSLDNSIFTLEGRLYLRETKSYNSRLLLLAIVTRRIITLILTRATSALRLERTFRTSGEIEDRTRIDNRRIVLSPARTRASEQKLVLPEQNRCDE